MAGLDDLFAQIPVAGHREQARCRRRRGEQRDPDAGAGARRRPAAQRRRSDDIDSSKLESAVDTQAASGLLDGGVSVDQVDEHEGDKIVAKIFGGNDSKPGRLGAGRAAAPATAT